MEGLMDGDLEQNRTADMGIFNPHQRPALDSHYLAMALTIKLPFLPEV